MPRKKTNEADPPEYSVTKTQLMPSHELMLFMATGADSFPCCFCKDKIVGNDKYHFLYVEKGKKIYRRAHIRCVERVLRDVIVVRDRNRRSEDLFEDEVQTAVAGDS